MSNLMPTFMSRAHPDRALTGSHRPCTPIARKENHCSTHETTSFKTTSFKRNAPGGM